MSTDLSLPPAPGSSCNPKTFSGWVTFLVASVPTCAAGLVGGAVSVAQGNSFEKGFDETCEYIGDNCLDPVIKFADEHNDAAVKGVIGGAMAVLGGAAMGSVVKGPKK